MNDSENRKERNEKLLRDMGVSINPSLPLIESEAEAKLRAPQDVARRAIVLCSYAAVAHGVDRNETVEFLKDEGLWEHASRDEISFFDNPNPDEKSVILGTWRSEAIWILLWALGHISELGMPVEQCDSNIIVDIIPGIGESTKDFIANAKLRSISEILDVSDLMYRSHWATRDRGINNHTEHANLDDDIVMEWHYAINWLTCYDDNDWDDVTTDT